MEECTHIVLTLVSISSFIFHKGKISLKGVLPFAFGSCLAASRDYCIIYHTLHYSQYKVSIILIIGSNVGGGGGGVPSVGIAAAPATTQWFSDHCNNKVN